MRANVLVRCRALRLLVSRGDARRAAGARSQPSAATGTAAGAAAAGRSRSGSSPTGCPSGSSSCTRCRSRRSTSSCCSGTADGSVRQIRHREPDRGDAGGRRRLAVGARSRRCRSITSARISAPARRPTRRRSGCTCRSRGLADALPLMADVALRPTFPKDELERQRQERLTSIIQARDEPGDDRRRLASPACSTDAVIATARRSCRHRRNHQGVQRPTISRRSTRRRSVRTTRALIAVGDVTADQRSCRCSKRTSDRGRRRRTRRPPPRSCRRSSSRPRAK